jgi:hypothetical protein
VVRIAVNRYLLWRANYYDPSCHGATLWQPEVVFQSHNARRIALATAKIDQQKMHTARGAC